MPLTWYISTKITLSGLVSETLWELSMRPAIVLITTSRLRRLWLRIVGRIAYCAASVDAPLKIKKADMVEQMCAGTFGHNRDVDYACFGSIMDAKDRNNECKI